MGVPVPVFQRSGQVGIMQAKHWQQAKYLNIMTCKGDSTLSTERLLMSPTYATSQKHVLFFVKEIYKLLCVAENSQNFFY